MNVVGLLLGERPLPHLKSPPLAVRWRRIRPKPTPAVRAERAAREARVNTGGGKLEAHTMEDFIVQYADGDRAVVRGDIFARTYEALGGGLYRKRTDIVLRYFTLKRHVLVDTIEGPQHAAPGDWIVQGLEGELWPVPRDKAHEKYEPI